MHGEIDRKFFHGVKHIISQKVNGENKYFSFSTKFLIPPRDFNGQKCSQTFVANTIQFWMIQENCENIFVVLPIIRLSVYFTSILLGYI